MLMDTHITSPPFLIVYCELSMFFMKDVESTSGSGPESFYTPEPSPTDRDSSGSGGLSSRVCTFVFVQLFLFLYVFFLYVFNDLPSFLCH